MSKAQYKTVIGLEIHIHLKTASKLFCRCENSFGGEPNSRTCPVCTGQPGVLPVINLEAVKLAVKASLALGCRINKESIFARKQYFYPDLPKNYQISQYNIPLAEGGSVNIEGEEINITRAHMEEDAGKLIHTEDSGSLVDYNRTGTPLLEIVSEPEISSPRQAAEYLKTLRNIFRYCGVSDCDMEKGSMRCDANISLMAQGDKKFGVKSEIKNMNSFKGVESALSYEQMRQEKKLKEGGEIVQETRLWDESKEVTRSMRSKEEAHDYRYFPDPDLPPLTVDKNFIEEIKATIPELPREKADRYMKDYNLSEYDSGVLTSEKEIADYFEKALEKLEEKTESAVKTLANWIMVELTGQLNADGMDISQSRINSEMIAELVSLIENGTISGKMAKRIFELMWDSGDMPSDIVEKEGMKQITAEDAITLLCKKTIENHPQIVEKYLSGKEGVIGALVGSIMKETRGQANPRLVNQKLRELLADKK
ncbi:MAG: Asp-tRNA(Asn)/Glu-tRNA(Gln) amidotransferase subunit GatB [Elusimicrobiota bacterium]|nr:Asp-tRNA(Asn)/Glu-tRNA(Gln) amidotransferase subunit GatB [Elusimicrobiota bacterium]